MKIVHDVYDVQSSGTWESEEIMSAAILITLCWQEEMSLLAIQGRCQLKDILSDRADKQNSSPLMGIHLPWNYWPRQNL